MFIGAMLGLLLLSYILYQYFADPQESYFFAMIVVVLSLTVSVLCVLLIPVDIYVISVGAIRSEALHVTIAQETVQNAYLVLFVSLLFLAFFLVPHAYFYGEERSGGDTDKALSGNPKLTRQDCMNAMRSTAFFIGFIFILVILGLNFRPGHTESLDGVWQRDGQAVRWLSDLFDVQHRGLNAISFSIACLTFVGVGGWVLYTAYGMAMMPFVLLRGTQTASEQRQDLESSIATVREKYRTIQAKYGTREDDSIDLSSMRAADRKELNRLQREQKCLMQQNYRLQDLEKRGMDLVQRLLQCLVPLRWTIGIGMESINLLVVSSLFLTLVDRMLHSPCSWSCGFTLRERQIFNPADELLLRLSRIFPVDFVVVGVVVLYVFFASVFGIVCLGVRIFWLGLYSLRARKSMPQALLVLCNIMAYILLALCMALLTIAPNYTSFGSQTIAAENGSTSWCSLVKPEEGTTPCKISVISTFFTRIAIAMPIFSVAYFLANWAFIAVFCGVCVHLLACAKRRPLLDTTAQEWGEEEEEVGLLSFT